MKYANEIKFTIAFLVFGVLFAIACGVVGTLLPASPIQIALGIIAAALGLPGLIGTLVCLMG